MINKESIHLLKYESVPHLEVSGQHSDVMSKPPMHSLLHLNN